MWDFDKEKPIWYNAKKRGSKMIGNSTLATDVLRQIKREDLKIRILIIVISGALLLVTNFLWFIQWNSPPKEKEEITFELEDEDENDNPQSENEKSE